MALSSSVPAAPTDAPSCARCKPVTAVLRYPRGELPWLRAALAMVLLSSLCYVSAAKGKWSTAQLSVARPGLAATSVGNVAIFAGGGEIGGGNF